jgi:hypothetical protein
VIWHLPTLEIDYALLDINRCGTLDLMPLHRPFAKSDPAKKLLCSLPLDMIWIFKYSVNDSSIPAHD